MRRLSSTLTTVAALVTLTLSAGCALDSRANDPQLGDDALKIIEAQRLASTAQDLERKKLYDDAIEFYKRSIMVYRDFPASWNNLGALLMDRGKYLEARECFQIAAQLSPTDPRPLANLGALYAKQSWLDEAARYYGQALERNPNDLESLRESVRLDHERDIRTSATLDRCRRALMLEKDPAWRDYLLRQETVVQSRVKQSEGFGG